MIASASAAATGATPAAADRPLLSVRALTKRFSGVVAVDGVDLFLARGEIVALLGQNGAGKSTLIQVLSGVHPAGSYSGEIAFEGRSYHPSSVSEAEALGIAFLAQEISIVPDLSVAANLLLNSEPARFGLLDRPLMLALARAALLDFGLDLDPAQRMGDLDLAAQQLILIVRALSKKARLLILDEPTAALTSKEAARLFERMRALARRGIGIVFVSHRLAEVFAVSDRIVVMRDGRVNGAFETRQTSGDAVVASMVGTRVASQDAGRQRAPGATALAVRKLTVRDAGGTKTLVDAIDLELASGEIVGLFGLLGAGAVEAAMALFGAWQGPVSGETRLFGKSVRITDPSGAVHSGIGLISQDRRDGLSGEHSIHDNVVLANLPALSNRAGFLKRMQARRQVQDLFSRLGIKAPDMDVLVGTLSGGNQQKVQVARWLAAGCKVLLLIDPTRGVDVGARAEISRIWKELAQGGCAVMLVSSDAEEVVEVCDRAIVLRSGAVAGHLGKSDLTEENLLGLAAGDVILEGREK